MGFDYSDFKNYRDRFNTMYRQFHKWLNDFMLKEGMRFIAEVKPRTPVDTGDLRNHWQIQGMSREGDNIQVWFVNTMHYATYVEYGHAKPYKAGATEGGPDWVQGYFMMTVSIDVINRNMPKRFDSAFTSFLDSLGVL